MRKDRLASRHDFNLERYWQLPTFRRMSLLPRARQAIVGGGSIVAMLCKSSGGNASNRLAGSAASVGFRDAVVCKRSGGGWSIWKEASAVWGGTNASDTEIELVGCCTLSPMLSI